MTAISEVECWTMLGIHPKTLRNWLRQAHLHFVAHPTDARLKCLTPEQVQQLAALHARPLPSPAAASPALRQEAPLLPSPLSPPRSEDHTSELQSHLNLVCRLLLEKNNSIHVPTPTP